MARQITSVTAETVWNLGPVSKFYIESRPKYSQRQAQRIIDYYNRQCQHKKEDKLKLAVDVGCGSGQFTTLLSGYCEQVIGIDSSAAQIAEAKGPGNVTFRVGKATNFSDEIPTGTVDLITVAEAFHFFDQKKFFAECDHCLRPGGIVCIFGYIYKGFPEEMGTQPYKELIAVLRDKFDKYWPSGSDILLNRYANVDVPYENVERYSTTMLTEYTKAKFIEYIRSMSGYALYQKENQDDDGHVLDSLINSLTEYENISGKDTFEFIFDEFGIFCQKKL